MVYTPNKSDNNIYDPNVIKMFDIEKYIINTVQIMSSLGSKAFCVRNISKNLKIIFRDGIPMNNFRKLLPIMILRV